MRRMVSLQHNFLGIFYQTFAWTIWTLVPVALAQSLQTLFRKHVPTRNDHWRILDSGLFLADGADKDGVVYHALWQWGLEGHFLTRSPLGAFAFDRVQELHKLR